MTWKRWHRAWVLLLHLLVVGLAPLADAVASRASAEARMVHVESRGRGGCPPAHDHLRCQVCRVIGHEALGAERCTWTPGERWRFLPPAPAVERLVPRRGVVAALGPRGPPADGSSARGTTAGTRVGPAGTLPT